MSENALVNAGAVAWPHDSACFTIRSMQTKLHRWAGENPSAGSVTTGSCSPAPPASSDLLPLSRQQDTDPWTPKPAAAAKRQLTSG